MGPALSKAPRSSGTRGVHRKIDLRIDAARAGDVARAGDADIAEPGRIVPEEQLERRPADHEVLGSSEKSDA